MSSLQQILGKYSVQLSSVKFGEILLLKESDFCSLIYSYPVWETWDQTILSMFCCCHLSEPAWTTLIHKRAHRAAYENLFQGLQLSTDLMSPTGQLNAPHLEQLNLSPEHVGASLPILQETANRNQIPIPRQGGCTLTVMGSLLSSSSFSKDKSRPSSCKLSLLNRDEHTNSLLPSSDQNYFHCYTKQDYNSEKFWNQQAQKRKEACFSPLTLCYPVHIPQASGLQ